MSTERVVTFTKDWPRQLAKPLIGEICKACTMLTCCDTAAGCKLRQELRKRGKACYQRRRKKVLRQMRRKYRADPESFLERTRAWRERNREKARASNRRWREENRERYNERHKLYKRRKRAELMAAREAP